MKRSKSKISNVHMSTKLACSIYSCLHQQNSQPTENVIEKLIETKLECTLQSISDCSWTYTLCFLLFVVVEVVVMKWHIHKKRKAQRKRKGEL